MILTLAVHFGASGYCSLYLLRDLGVDYEGIGGYANWMQRDCVHYIGNATGNLISRRFPLLAPTAYSNVKCESQCMLDCVLVMCETSCDSIE